MLNNKSTSTNAPATVTGQASLHVQQVSQGSANKPMEEQLAPELKIESLPKNQIRFYEYTEDEILRDTTVIARPLVLDECYKIKPIDKHWAFHWTNCKAGGLLLNKALAYGWLPADPKDLLPVEQGGHRGIVKENRIYLGDDVVLMKLPRHIYAGMIKGNLMRSMGMVSSKNAVKSAITQANRGITGGHGVANFERDKVEFFKPEGRDLMVTDRDGREVGDVLAPTSGADKVFETL